MKSLYKYRDYIYEKLAINLMNLEQVSEARKARKNVLFQTSNVYVFKRLVKKPILKSKFSTKNVFLYLITY